MRGLYIGEGILRSLVKLLIVPEQKSSIQFKQHMLSLYNSFLQILMSGGFRIICVIWQKVK